MYIWSFIPKPHKTSISTIKRERDNFYVATHNITQLMSYFRFALISNSIWSSGILAYGVFILKSSAGRVNATRDLSDVMLLSTVLIHVKLGPLYIRAHLELSPLGLEEGLAI